MKEYVNIYNKELGMSSCGQIRRIQKRDHGGHK